MGKTDLALPHAVDGDSSEVCKAREPGPGQEKAVLFMGLLQERLTDPRANCALALKGDSWSSPLSADTIHLTFEDSLHNWQWQPCPLPVPVVLDTVNTLCVDPQLS